ncbi:DUF3253 domain-containing protein [Salinisphaera hydrothermalis]|uniref:DUF3253 domain-containing protein n=1 Tax=Salinisphaera hydrothermalis TaxID=563188 RepID=UPI003341B360
MSVSDQAIARAIVDRVHERGPDATCCPSEIARDIASEQGGCDWRELMPRVRQAAVDLAHRQRIEIRQRGEQVDPDNFSGPIRLGLPRV